MASFFKSAEFAPGVVPRLELSSGIFTLSLDFELIWGKLDKPEGRRFRRLCRIEREEVVGRLLELFAEYDISATWCTVGGLFISNGDVSRGDPLMHARELVERIRRCPTPQEIGSHSFTHIIFNDPVCTRAKAADELAASVQAAESLGLRMTSFAFPRNRIRHLDLLPQYGFTAFRGQDVCWYERTERRRWFHRLGHVFDVLRAAQPPAVMPVWSPGGLWEIPGSMLYTPSYGIRGAVPAKWRVARARKGLRTAAAQKRIFHLWFHPTDVVVRKDAMLRGLREIFSYASELRAAGQLAILPMGRLAELAEQSTAGLPLRSHGARGSSHLLNGLHFPSPGYNGLNGGAQL